MKLFLVLLLLPVWSLAEVKVETFVIQIQDRSMKVLSPDKKRPLVTVLVENRSLSDQVAKFATKGRSLKFISVPAGKSETVEIDNREGGTLYFIPLSPAFQEAELVYGKKAYEIPSKK